ncbi:hypothetical protein [Halorarius litoreus]|uniref:hypothetical protein n=1 Tax=Halorarius litoreus TaxID=2962676 RepID=UPI0020CDFD49|nr:hypothetical protein [Halorarius litoreus]
MSWWSKVIGDDYENDRRKRRLVEATGALVVVVFFCLLFVTLFTVLKFGVVRVIPLAGYQTTFSSGWLVGVSITALAVTIWTTFRLSDALNRAKYRYLAD